MDQLSCCCKRRKLCELKDKQNENSEDEILKYCDYNNENKSGHCKV